MLTRLSLAKAALFATFILSPLAADAARITCPHEQIRREVTTPLPSGWWNTPIVNSLRSVRVQDIGGRKALICDYGGAGTVQRYAPDGQNCTARGTYFDCAAAGPSTFSTKLLNIQQTYTADLDRGAVGGPGADLWFQAETRDLLYLVPQNGAQIGVGNRANRGYSGCSTARFNRNRVSLRDIPPGSYVCMRTNEGRVSQFRVNSISGGSPKTLEIGYTTWR